LLLGGVIFFTLAYSQSPLFTSNQNQYFLHGLAQAGYGYLHEDWLANTLDPTPVFSKFIEISWRVLPWQPIFYVYFSLLAGVFLFSLLGITDFIWKFSHSRLQQWGFITILIVLFSAGTRYFFARLLGVQWEFLFDGGVAGQRLLGTVFQPSTFGVFLLLSIYQFLRGSSGWAVLSLLIAATFHPTYLLSAGILTAIYMGLTFWETRQWRAPLVIGLGALLGVSPILWHTIGTFGLGAKGAYATQITDQARKILIEYRIPHHAIATEWLDGSVLVKLIFIGIALFILANIHKPWRSPLSRSIKLFHLVFWPSLVALTLTLVQIFTGNAILALLFPWRLSTWLVPLATAVIVGWGLHRLNTRVCFHKIQSWMIGFYAILILVFTVLGILKFQISWVDKHTLPDRAMMAQVGTQKQSGQVYLIPLKMQDFRLETGAPAYVEFKSIPYLDQDVIEWHRRVDFARKIYERPRCRLVEELAAEEGVTHIVLPTDNPAGQCKQTNLLYQDSAYAIYAITAKNK
jgi:hypothetical protein